MESIFPQTETPNTDNEPDSALLAQLRSGAGWFYWIAGLSLVNSLIYAFGGEVTFIAGLAITQLIDGISDAFIAEGAPAALKAVATVFNVGLSILFALFGYFAGKGIGWVFIVGIVIYVIDGLLYLVLGSMFAAGFHAFALFFIIRGFIASHKLAKLPITEAP